MWTPSICADGGHRITAIQLTKAREREREDAIRQGLVADPEKPRALSEAITPVGTCQDMCAEYERVQRVVQDDVWPEEKGADGEPDESRMVKKFRRSAAGLEEQLPSDLRSPQVLKQTCDYLFDEVIGNAPSFARVHHFIWDRTRAIRNDFSIQQLTKLEELRIAVECYERIARFHILSLHQLASPERPYAKYDWSQEREQLDRTLLSLMQYYEDTRTRITFPNEAEFRAYCVISQLRSPTPDLEDTVQAWPRHILRDRRVRKALDVYASACTVMDIQGPLNPKAHHLIARQDWQRVWVLLASNEVSYLMGCAAEVYFNSIRRSVLNALFRTFRANYTLPTPDLTLDLLCELFAFDDEEEVRSFCQFFGFSFKDRDDGHTFLDLTSVSGRVLPQPNAEMPNQLKSSLVENKRFGRTLPAVINGMTVQQAQSNGLILEEEQGEEMDGMEDEGEEENRMSMEADQFWDNDDEDSLFIPENNKPKATLPDNPSVQTNGLNPQPKPSPFSWGNPSEAAKSPFENPTQTAQPSGSGSKPKFDFLSGGAKSGGEASPSKPSFDFLSGSAKPDEKATTGPSGFNFLQAGAKPSSGAEEAKPLFSFPTSTTTPPSSTPSGPKFDFSGGASLGGFGKIPQDQTPTSNGDIASQKSESGLVSSEDSILAKPVQGQAAALPPFQFAAPAAPKPSSPERASTTPSPPLDGTAPTSSGPTPATVESAPLSVETPNPFLQPRPKSPSQTSSETPSFPTQTKQAQPHATAPSANAPPSFSNASPSHSPLNTGLRRPSTSADTRPKKPSPLSNSFTAADDSSTSARKPPPSSAESAIEKPLRRVTLPAPQVQQPKPSQASGAAPAEEGQLKKPVPFKRPRPPSEEPAESFDATVTRIARELVNDPISGYLKQYVEYKASQIITSVQEQIAAEKMKLRLSELRLSTLYRKYVKRWISVVWQRRLAKSGKDRRQRRRKRLEEGFDDGSNRGDGSVRGSSPAGSALEVSSWKDHQENVDAMFQRTMNSRSLARPAPTDQQARAGSKRPNSSHGENGLVPRASAHKRLKSTSHVDDRGRVTKPTATTHPSDDILKRSSFLGFSVNGPSPPNKNTTKSNYFRLKAMGVHRADELSASRGTKRPRTESAQPSQTSPPHLRKSVSAASSPDESKTRSLMPPPSSALSRAQKAKEEDDVLFARIRAARESLTVGALYMKEEVAKDDELRRSLGDSQSSNESPSMVKARADARTRASRTGSPERDVPAYRLRESKFVPREHYGKAIERAKEMRESRSRDTSRAASRPESRLDHPAEKTSTQALGFSFGPSTNHDDYTQDVIASGLPAAKTQEKSPSLTEPPASFSPLERLAPFSFANHATEMSNANPFLHSKVPETQDASGYSQYTPFTPTKAPTAFGTQPSFGTQSAFGTLGAQTTFSSQQPACGFQPSLDYNSAATSNSLGLGFASASNPAFGHQQQAQSSFAAPQDQTIHPDLINQSLANSFGSHHEEGFEPSHHKQPAPPQEDSYMDTQTVSLLSDDEDDEQESAADRFNRTQANGFVNDAGDEELLDQATDEDAFQPPYGHANPFAMLAGQNANGESRSPSQASGDEMYDHDRFDKEGQMANGFQSQEKSSDEGDAGFDAQYYGDEDEEGANGDIDEESDLDEEVDEEGNGFDSEDDEEEEEESAPPLQPWKKIEYDDPWRAKPEPNPALQGLGKTEDEPIELDSD